MVNEKEKGSKPPETPPMMLSRLEMRNGLKAQPLHLFSTTYSELQVQNQRAWDTRYTGKKCNLKHFNLFQNLIAC